MYSIIRSGCEERRLSGSPREVLRESAISDVLSWKAQACGAGGKTPESARPGVGGPNDGGGAVTPGFVDAAGWFVRLATGGGAGKLGTFSCAGGALTRETVG